MYYLIDEDRKIIFGWTPKCGCSHIKYLFCYLTSIDRASNLHTPDDWKTELPTKIQQYTTILISRNPYERLVSGFRDKYCQPPYRDYLEKNIMSGIIKREVSSNIRPLSFSRFVSILVQSRWDRVNKHHFSPQTDERFDNNVLKSKKLVVYDIKKIDYAFIEKLYNKEIPLEVRNYKGLLANREIPLEKDAFDLDINAINKFKIRTKFFYNETIKTKVYNFYKNDFIFFSSVGINYAAPV